MNNVFNNKIKKISDNVNLIGTNTDMTKMIYTYHFQAPCNIEDILLKANKFEDTETYKQKILDELVDEFKQSLNKIIFNNPGGLQDIISERLENFNKYGIDKTKGKWLEEKSEFIDDVAYATYINEKIRTQGNFGVIFSFSQEEFIEKRNTNADVNYYYNEAIITLRKEKIKKIRNGKK